MPTFNTPQVHLYLHQALPIFKARVNAPGTISYPLTEIPYNMVTAGVYTNVEIDMTLLLGTTEGGDDLGRVRVQGLPTASVIPIGRVSAGIEDGTLYLQHGAYITILNDFRVWAKLPRMVVQAPPLTPLTYKDSDLEVGDNNVNPPPVANCGPGFAGYIDPDTGVLDVGFTGENSFAVADGATITDYFWDMKDGTFTAGTSASDNPDASFPPGFRWVLLKATDSNGKEHMARCPVLAVDPANDVTVQGAVIGTQRVTRVGQTLDFRLLNTRTRVEYADGCLVMLWWDEAGNPDDRRHMKFIGWHQSDTFSMAADKTGLMKETTLTCVDVAGRLASLPGFAQALERSATVGWEFMPTLTMKKALHYLLHWHSTALALADFSLEGMIGDYPSMRLDSAGGNLFAQVNHRALSMVPDHYITCNVLGQLQVLPDWMLMDEEDRPDPYGTITETYWSQIRSSYQRPPRVHVLNASAVVSSTDWIIVDGEKTLPLAFSIAPGPTFGQGTTEAVQGEQLALSQEALDACTGHRFARLNARYGLFEIVDPSGDLWAFEPANMLPLVLEISAASAAQRGLDFTSARGMVHEMSATYHSDRTGTWVGASITWEKEISGLAALPVSTAPVVEAGPSQTLDFPDSEAALAGSATDDGLPNPPGALTYLWTKISGPGTVTFDDDADPSTDATFSTPGFYVLQLSAFDGEGTGVDTVSISVGEEEAGPWTPPLPGDPTVYFGDIGAYILFDGAHVMRTWDFLAASPVWELVDTGITGTILDGQYVHVDADTVGMWLMTSAGIFVCMDIMAATPTWSHVLNLATMRAGQDEVPGFASQFQAMYAYASEPGYLIVATAPSSQSNSATREYMHAYSWHTHDYGLSWTLVDMDMFYTTNLGYTSCYPWCDVYGIAIHASSPTIWMFRGASTIVDNGAVFRSTDGGHTWTQRFSISDFTGEATILAPFPDIDGPGYIARGNSLAANWPNVYVSFDAFATAPIQPDVSGYRGLVFGLRINAHTFEPDTILAYFQESGTSNAFLLESTDNGATFTLLYNPARTEANVQTPNGWPPDTDVWIDIRRSSSANVASVVIRYTDDRFATVQDKRGNLAALIMHWVGDNANGFALPRVGANA